MLGLRLGLGLFCIQVRQHIALLSVQTEQLRSSSVVEV